MDNLMLALTNNSGVWESVLNWFFSFLGNVGWCVVILTILIKLALSPLEYMQKKGMKKMTAALTLMQPEMEKLKAKCGNNQALYNQKVQELYKKNNVNPAAGCGPMFLFLIISSVVFITFFSCLTKVSTEQINTQYNQITNVYTVAYDYYNGETVEVNGVEYKIRDDLKQQLFENNSDYKLYLIEYDNAEAGSEIKSYASRDEYATYKRAQELSQQAVVDGITLYEAEDGTDNIFLNGFTQIKQGFLWVKNIWRSDNYSSVFPNAEEFIQTTNLNFNQKEYVISADDVSKYASELITEKDGVYTVKGYYQNLDGSVVTESESEGKKAFVNTFNTVTSNINKTYSGWNGYLILVVLVALLTIFSSKLTNLGNKTVDKKGFEVDVKPQKNNVMMVVLTALFVWITWSYSAAFALYIVVSSLIGIPISIAINYIMTRKEYSERLKNEISYSRYKKGE